MNPRTLALSIALLNLSTAAQDPGPEVSRAWTDFVHKNGEWTAQWCPATGTPSAIWGAGLRLRERPIEAMNKARALSVSILDKHRKLLGTGGSTYVEQVGAKVGRVWVFVYSQKFSGLPVIDGRADVRINENGVLAMFGSQALPIPAGFNVTPNLTSDQARLIGWQHVDQTPPSSEINLRGPRQNQLVIWGDTSARTRTAVRLAWEVPVDASSVIGRTYVDALTGQVLEWVTDRYECFGHHHPTSSSRTHAPTGMHVEVIPGSPTPAATVSGTVMAWTNTSVMPNAALKNVPVVGLKIGSTYTDENGKFSLPGTSVPVTISFVGRHCSNINPSQGTKFSRSITLTGANNTIQIYSSNAQQFDRSQSTCYHFTDKSMRFVRGLLGNSTQLDRLSGVRATVNQGQACNAFYSLNAMTFFHAAGGCVNTAYNTVVSHEWGHGLDDCFGGIARGQMQEGVADTIPMLMNDDPIVGRDFQGAGTKVRTGTNTRKYPPSGSVHQQGEVWMGWMWDCRTNFVASLGQPKGLDLARKLFVGVFPTNPPNQSTGVREIFILDDDDGNLNNGTPHYLDLEKACVKRNMPFPKRTNPNAGSYKTYGMGCKGTGKMPSACGSANTAGLFLDLAGFVNTEYAIEVTASGNLSVSGFEIQSKSRQSGNVTIQTRLYTANAQGQPDQQVRSGTMVIGATPGFYKAQFSSPYQVSNGTKFFIGFLNPASTVSVPIVLTGTPSTVFTKGLIGWGRTLFSFPWSWKLTCTGGPGAIPTLTNDGAPELGSSFKLHLESAAANANAVFLIGSSKTRWAGFSLPLDLNPIGAPGCSILAAAEIQIPVTANANGSAVLTLSIPNQTSLFRKPFFDQFLIKDTGANRLGWAVSNAGEAKVGKKL